MSDFDNKKQNRVVRKDLSELKSVLNKLNHSGYNSLKIPYFGRDGKKESVNEGARKIQLENDNEEQNIKLKRYTLIALFLFLTVETLLVFKFAFKQADLTNCFRLEKWSFNLLVTATISQITYMLKIAVEHLFPRKEKGNR